MKTFLTRSILGIFFGSFLALVTIVLISNFGEKDMLDAAILSKNALGTVFCGWFFAVTPLIFENEKLTLPVQTTLHFLCVTLLVFHRCLRHRMDSIHSERIYRHARYIHWVLCDDLVWVLRVLQETGGEIE